MIAAAPAAISFTPVTEADLPMLAGWLARPHWREWWGEPVEQLGQIRDMLHGIDPHQDPFLIRLDGEPVGYIQRWRIGPHQTPEWSGENPWLMALSSDTVGVDLALADPARLSQGLGSRALRQFVRELWRDGHRAIIIDPDPENGRAVAAYRKAGFRPVPHLEGRTDDVLIMQFHPDQAAP
jgi:aminoglycoside 6'-N-acetyltransferase